MAAGHVVARAWLAEIARPRVHFWGSKLLVRIPTRTRLPGKGRRSEVPIRETRGGCGHEAK